MKVKQDDIVAVDFPFTDGSGVKRRPALLLSGDLINKTGDVVLVQITSKSKNDLLTTPLKAEDLTASLPLTSLLRLHKIFTLDQTLIVKQLSHLKEAKFQEVMIRLFNVLK